MERYGPHTYGDHAAGHYDADWADLDPTAAVGTLAELAGGRGPVLELGIGSGRVALPLAARGVEVHGVDASEKMVALLRAKPGGDAIPVTMGDFADVPVQGRYRVVYIPFNTFFGLTSQEDQVRCFANVAEHLDDGGVFVIEVFVPDLARFDRGQRMSAIKVAVDSVSFEVSRYDPVHQRSSVQQVRIGPGGIEMEPLLLRFAWPAELDLMARLAGLRLRDRWGGWDRRPFDAESRQHVSVYARVS